MLDTKCHVIQSIVKKAAVAFINLYIDQRKPL